MGHASWNLGRTYHDRTLIPMKSLLKLPLLVSAVVIVARVILERTGAPPRLSSALSTLGMTMLICPVYFAARILVRGETRPYRVLLQATVAYGVLTRFMVLPTYWLARSFQWPDHRFESVVRDGVSPFKAYLLTPLNPAVLIMSLIVGCIVGLVTMIVARLFMKKTSRAVLTV